jgi:adenosylhomocysteine nucleosidase
VLISNFNSRLSQTAAAPPLSSIRAGVIAALPAEGRCLTKRKLYPGKDSSLSEALHLQLSGIGPERARRAAEILLSAGAKALISWGVAGGLAPHLKSGTLLLPGRVQLMGGEEYRPDPQWRQCLINHLGAKLPFSSDTLCHTENILSSPEEKAYLYHQTRCAAVDMESGAVAKAAVRAGVPFLVIRAVADPAQSALPASALRALNAEGQLQGFTLLASLFKHPKDILDLWQLAEHFRAAKATLRAVVARVGPTLLAP